MKDLAVNFGELHAFVNKLIEDNVGGATTQALHAVLSTKEDQLQLELALAMDMEVLCTTTYKMEGDGLEILLIHDALEDLRLRGRMLGTEAAHLPNASAILRAKARITIGMATMEYYEAPHHTWFEGKILALGHNSWTIGYPDGSTLVVNTEREIRAAVDVRALPEWQPLLAQVNGAFTYLEARLTDNCAATYGCKEQHRITGLLRAFNPAFAHGKVDALWVQRLASLPCFGCIPHVDALLLQEMPSYLNACQGVQVDVADPQAFATQVLSWWASNHTRFPTWAEAARIAMCLTPNSASCERVFSLLACMFGSLRSTSLADQVETSVMLRYNRNKRDGGC